MKIPLVDLNRQYISIKEEIDSSIKRILDNTSFILGKEVEDFENNLAKFCECDYAVGVSSGSSALFLSLKAYGIKEGDEVITVPNSFIATVEAIIHCGAKPVFVDINEDTMLMDISKIEEKITSKTKAILPVHLYGQICDMDSILEIAKKHNLKVIEDAAQAIGAEYKGKKLPISETAIFSFFPAKNLGCYGDGGAVITNNKEIAEKIFKLRNHGKETKYESKILGYGERLDALQAAILNVKLNHLKEWTRKRRENASSYSEFLKDVIKIPFEEENCKGVYYMYEIRTKDREKLKDLLKENNIDTGIHFPIPLHLQPSLNFLGYKEGDFPVTEKVSKEILSLPIFPELEEEEIKFICDKIKDFL